MSRRSRNPEAAREAVDKYVEFNRFDPKKIIVGGAFSVPSEMYLGGKAKWVTYSSKKVDPETLRKPHSAINYIHEHDAGVTTYLASSGGQRVDVPDRFRDVPALARLGFCLGFCFEDESGEKQEAEGRPPLPDLYATPDGKCLLVIQSMKTVLAMMWGGALGVFARGIDG